MESAIIAIVIIFQPNISELIDNIAAFIDSVSEVLVWRNSHLSQEDVQRVINSFSNSSKIVFVGDETNKGIGTALNYALTYASHNNYEYLMSMDQDSQWKNIAQYLEKMKEYTEYTIFGPEVINYYEESFDNKSVYRKIVGIKDVDFVITSGAVYRVKDLLRIGGFKEEYFIDAIDEEICYRASSVGFQTAIVEGAYLIQKFGEPRKVRFLWKETRTSNYSAFRYYYIVRNHIWLSKESYISKKVKKIMCWNYVFMPLVKVLLFETNKCAKVKRIFKAYVDGVF